jgi:hypothetical protein
LLYPLLTNQYSVLCQIFNQFYSDKLSLSFAQVLPTINRKSHASDSADDSSQYYSDDSDDNSGNSSSNGRQWTREVGQKKTNFNDSSGSSPYFLKPLPPRGAASPVASAMRKKKSGKSKQRSLFQTYDNSDSSSSNSGADESDAKMLRNLPPDAAIASCAYDSLNLRFANIWTCD